MARNSVFFLIAAIVISFFLLPSALAGPACARRNWQAVNCVQACKNKWGWPGKTMGTDPWGAVMKSGPNNMNSVVTQACGSTTSTEAGIAPLTTSSNSTPPAIAVPLPNTKPTIVGLTSTTTTSSPTSQTSSTYSHSPSSFLSPASSHKHSTSAPSLHQTFKPFSSLSPSFSPVSSSTPKPSPKPSPKSSPESSTLAPAPSSAGSTTSGSDIDQYLSAHNSVRLQHGASPLTWSSTLASAAQQWVDGCKFQHSGGSLGPYGENLAAGTGNSYDIAAAIESWTDEVSEYDSSNPQPSHFTQVVWKATTQVGCALQMCNGIFSPSFGTAKYYVCEYSPQGNVIGEFAQNVQV